MNGERTIALIGTGAMGFAVAKRLLACGTKLVVFNRTRAVAAPLEALGARVASSVDDACAAADCILLCLPSATAASSVVGELIASAGVRGKTIVQLGLVGRRDARRLELEVRRAGGAYLDASPCGSRREAATGGLVLLVGGRAATFGHLRSLLALLGTPIHVGGTRAAATAGLAMTLLSFSHVTSFCHAVGSLRREGASAEALLRALARSAPFTDAGAFLNEHARSNEPTSPKLRNAMKRMLRASRVASRESGMNGAVVRAVREQVRRAPIDDVARFVRLAWPSGDDVETAAARGDVLARVVFELIASTFAAHALVAHMLAAEGVSMSVVLDVFSHSPLFNGMHRALAAAYAGRLALRNYGNPSSTIRILHEELQKLTATLSSLGIDRRVPRAMAKVTGECIDEGLAEADFFAVHHVIDRPEQSEAKRRALEDNSRYVNPGRVGFFTSAGMDFVMGKREGAYVHDIDGKVSLFDLHCNGGVFNLGHRHPEIAGALRDALDRLDIGNHHLLSAERGALARRLAELLPGDISRVVFGVSGGESVDLAIKLARAHTKRSKILFARGGYHGHTGFAVFAGDPRFYDGFADRPPQYEEVALGDIDALVEKLDADTAAVLFETIPASVGFPIPAPDFYARVRRACDDAGALLIIDEVQCGWGRSGKLWAIDHFDVVPDVMVLGKGMSAGHYPMSAVCYRPHLGAYLTRDSFRHQSTMGGAELGCAVVQKQLDILTEPAFLPRVRALSELLARELAALASRHPDVIKSVRQLGLLIGIVYAHPDVGPLMTRCAYDEGLLLVFAGLDPSVSQFLPPLTMTPDEVGAVIEKLDLAVTKARTLFHLMQRFAGGN